MTPGSPATPNSPGDGAGTHAQHAHFNFAEAAGLGGHHGPASGERVLESIAAALSLSPRAHTRGGRDNAHHGSNRHEAENTPLRAERTTATTAAPPSLITKTTTPSAPVSHAATSRNSMGGDGELGMRGKTTAHQHPHWPLPFPLVRDHTHLQGSLAPLSHAASLSSSSLASSASAGESTAAEGSVLAQLPTAQRINQMPRATASAVHTGGQLFSVKGSPQLSAGKVRRHSTSEADDFLDSNVHRTRRSPKHNSRRRAQSATAFPYVMQQQQAVPACTGAHPSISPPSVPQSHPQQQPATNAIQSPPGDIDGVGMCGACGGASAANDGEGPSCSAPATSSYSTSAGTGRDQRRHGELLQTGGSTNSTGAAATG